MDQRVKVRIGKRKVIELKQGSLEMKMEQGDVEQKSEIRVYYIRQIHTRLAKAKA